MTILDLNPLAAVPGEVVSVDITPTEVTPQLVIDMSPPAAKLLLSDSGWQHAGQPYRCVDRYTRTLEYRGKPTDAEIDFVRRWLAADDYCRQQGCRLERVHVSPEGDCTLTFATQIDSSD